MKLSKKRLHTLMFEFAYGSFFLYSLLGHISAIEMPFRYIRYLAVPFLIMLSIQGINKVTRQTVYLLMFISVLSVLSKDANLIKIVLLSLAAVGENLRDCIKFDIQELRDCHFSMKKEL